MNDLEICKRMAEIEDWKLPLKAYGSFGEVSWIIHNNPLTDDALMKRLIYDYELTIIWSRKVVMMYRKPNANPMDTVLINFADKSELDKACCLAIIEAHKDKANG